MTTTRTLAVIGAGLAGAKAAEAARDADFDGRIILIGDEPGAPYERPPLSKAVLRGNKEPNSARVHPEDFYTTHDIQLVTDCAAAIDLTIRRVELVSGVGIDFDAAILATGAAPQRLALPGAELAGVHYLRTLADAVRLRDAIRSSTRVAVIGAGWIGSEVAASARQMGADVVLVDPAPVPLQRVLGHEIGAVFRDLHATNGVDLRLGVGVAEFRGSKAVEEVVLGDGRVEAADVVVVGIGVTPRTYIADAAKLRVDNGILVDEYLETNAPGIYAAGDVANAWHPNYGQHLRVDHWANALNQGMTAGRNAVGKRERYTRLPYFFSDQYDLGMEYVGYGNPSDRVTVRGNLATREFIAFWHRGSIITAAMSVNVWDVVEDLKALIETGAGIDPARLANPDVPLSDLMP